MTPILQTENLSKYYVNGQNVVAGLNRINLSFQLGEFVAITGESGSGKSTLAHVLGGVLPYEDGELYISGEPTAHYDGADWETYRRDQVAFISQSYGILPGTTVYDNVASALRLGGMDAEQAAERTKTILEQVELWSMRRRRAARLSSGQKQRLAIARALAKPCPILIADEPTGNLDPENSDKVIALLAQAAKERLVILITHEFSEAEAYVTRHIRLHDGLVAGDEALRPAPAVTREPEPVKKRRALGGYTAMLQLRSRPVWTAIVLLFFAATAFAVFSFLGTFIVATDDTPTRIYQSDAFLNGDQTRIVAVRKDGGVMTQEDYDTIVALNYVEALERYGYIADMYYAYEPGVDYKVHYSLKNIGTIRDPIYISHESVEIITKDRFLATVPVGVESFLTGGRTPETVHEVVAGDEALLGQTLTVYLQNSMQWAVSNYIKLEVTVVGTTDHGDGLYFHDDLAAALTLNYLGTSAVLLPWVEDVAVPVDYLLYIDANEAALAEVNRRPALPFRVDMEPRTETEWRPMQANEMLISLRMYCRLINEMGGILPYETAYRCGPLVKGHHKDVFYRLVEDPNYDWPVYDSGGAMYVAGLHDSTLESLICVSPEFFQSFLEEKMGGAGDQVSLTITDYSYTDRVISALEKAGYYAISPYVLGSAVQDEELAAQRMQTLYVSMGALLAVILLQMIVLRALFNMENESYRLLSQIGLTWAGAKRSVWLQVLLFMVAGQVVGFGVILLGSHLGVERLVSLTKYLDKYYWLLLSAVHIVVSVVAAKGILASLKKKIYPLAARPRDLAPRRKEAAK